MTDTSDNRYHRQILFAPLAAEGQKSLQASRVLIVGVGGLGSWASELLARAGVGMLRLVDMDRVELTNIHRQAMYDEQHSAQGLLKVQAAQQRLATINSQTRIEAISTRLEADNIAELADGVDLIIDGSDNFHTRFVINDYAVSQNLPWTFCGVIGAQAQMMPVLPNLTSCLRCIYDLAPSEASADAAVNPVLGPAVSAISSMQVVEAIKILSGNYDAVNRQLVKLDMWSGRIQTLSTASPAGDCPCCQSKQFDYLENQR